MLAERRRKQKWSLNPRGKWWSEDSNKFGQRMLEKMGWTKGKGLGINEQGITEFANASFKKDTSGVGFDKSTEAWTEQMDKFSEFLRQLNENEDTVKNEDSNFSGQSTQLKSKQSNTHCKKFTCDNDTNKYMSKDLASIVDQNESVDKTQIKIEKNSNEKEVSDLRDDWYGVVTINGGNMVDYFKRKSNHKMFNYLKCNELNNDTSSSNNMTDNRTTDSESENDQHIGFGCTFKRENVPASNYGELKNSDDKSNFAFDNPCLRLNSPTETVCNVNDSSAKSTKKRKKVDDSHITEIDKHNSRKKLKTEIIDGDCKSGFVNPALNLDTNFEENCNGKEFEVIRTQSGLENCGLDLTDEKNDQKRVTFNDHVMLYEYNINSSKKKKGETTLDKFEVENKKKNKKKRKCESTTTPATNGFVNEALDVQILYEEINDNELNEHRNKKIKKRKICKTSNLETIQESPEKEITEIDIELVDTLDTGIVETGETNTVDQKSKKKKKKKDKEGKRTKVDDTAVFYVSSEESDIVTEVIINKNKKLKKVKEDKEEETISKKCKKEKKDKENYKSEKHAIQSEINNDQQDIRTLDTLDKIEPVTSTKEEEENDLEKTKQKKKKRKSINKEDCLNEINAIETLSISSIKEEEKEVKIKQKKKKRKSINKEDCPNEINVPNVEKEICDKENSDKEQDLNIKKLAKKDKKSKKSKDKKISDIEDSSNPNKEVVDINVIQQDEIENVECTDNTPSKKGQVSEAVDNINNSPWNVTARMSKRMLVTLFHNKAISEFPGSNIHNIKGYGADDYEL